jgi:hypothetical protein
MEMPFTLPPRRNPGDVIRSGEWNQIIDDLDDLNTRLQAVEGTPAGYIFVFPIEGVELTAGYVADLQPFGTWSLTGRGLVLPVGVKLKKLVLDVVSNTTDEAVVVTVRHNETTVVATINIPAGATGIFTATIANYSIPEGDRLSLRIDVSAPTTGSIKFASGSLLASLG